jgi:hypothetical protein
METIIVGTIITSVVALFAAMAIVPMVIELTASRPTAHLQEDQILSIDTLSLDRPSRRPITQIAPAGGALIQRDAA